MPYDTHHSRTVNPDPSDAKGQFSNPVCDVLETQHLEIDQSNEIPPQPMRQVVLTPLFAADREVKLGSGRRQRVIPAGAWLLFPLEELLAS